MAWKHNFKPPGGEGHGPANGDGFWGDKKGASKAARASFKPGNQAAAGTHTPKGQGRAAMTEKEKAEFARAHIFGLITAGTHEMTQLRAAEAFLNRVEGMPVARNITATTDDLSVLNDTALDKRRAELERAIREASAGGAPAVDPTES
jgi:hypothetical protein